MDGAPPDFISFFTPEEEWDGLLTGEWNRLRVDPNTRRLVLAGVPPSRQRALFEMVLVRGGTEDEASYEEAAAAALSLRERLEWDWDGSLRRSQPWLDEMAVVSADVPRTSPESVRQGSLDASALQRVLDAFVAKSVGADGNRTYGYSQGMADVAAWLLSEHQLHPWQGHACLHALVQRPFLRAIMGLDQACWNALCASFDAHLARAAGEVGRALATHLQSVGLAAFFFLPEVCAATTP
jgi:hypothetical protein